MIEQVVVVENQDVLGVEGGEFVEQRRQCEVDRVEPGSEQALQRCTGQACDVAVQRGQDVGPEPDRVVVTLVQ
jgi:hypothetical protein